MEEAPFGLVGMRERAEQIGGSLQINSSPGAGTEVIVDVPVKSVSGDNLVDVEKRISHIGWLTIRL